MGYKVSSADLSKITLNETDPVKAILQNIAILLSTPKGTAPLMRDFGIDMSFIDRPIPVVKAKMYAEIREALETWEPRARLIDVSFMDSDRPGVLIPVVEVEINE